MSGGDRRARATVKPRRIAFLAIAALVLPLAACSQAHTAADDAAAGARPQVVVTTNILGDVASEIAGDSIDVTTLMKPNADPHSFEISAQQAAALDSADLVVSNGLGLEEGMQRHLDRAAAAGVEQFVAGAVIDPLSYSSDEDHAAPKGPNGSAVADPHFWTDPRQMVTVTRALSDALADLPSLSDEARADIAARGSAYAQGLEELDEALAERFAEIPRQQRALVTNHHVFGYFAKRYDFTVLGTAIPGGTTLAAPSAADLDALVTAITDAGVPTIFAESSSPDRLMRVLADEAGITVNVVPLFTESLSEPGGGAESYLEMVNTNADRIVSGLKPRQPRQ